MSERKPTPGPWDCWDMDEFGWHVFAVQFGARAQGQDCRLSIAAVRPGRSHTEPSDNYYEQVANARLIAAAPDMLEALELHRAYEATPTDRGGKHGPKGRARTKWLAARDAAIAKAKGEA